MLSKENTGKQMAGNQSNREGTLLPNSQQTLKLPEDFTIGKAIGGGDCFLTQLHKGLNSLNLIWNLLLSLYVRFVRI